MKQKLGFTLLFVFIVAWGLYSFSHAAVDALGILSLLSGMYLTGSGLLGLYLVWSE